MVGMESGVGIIERAFQLARQFASLDEIKAQRKKEGYTSIDAHLAGKSIRSDLARALERGEQLPSIFPSTPKRKLSGVGGHPRAFLSLALGMGALAHSRQRTPKGQRTNPATASSLPHTSYQK